MKETPCSTSACRFCRHYQPEGRRGGSCQILGVPVESSWEACVLSSPAFDVTLENIEKSLEDILHLENSLQETSRKLNDFNKSASQETSKYSPESQKIRQKSSKIR